MSIFKSDLQKAQSRLEAAQSAGTKATRNLQDANAGVKDCERMSYEALTESAALDISAKLLVARNRARAATHALELANTATAEAQSAVEAELAKIEAERLQEKIEAAKVTASLPNLLACTDDAVTRAYALQAELATLHTSIASEFKTSTDATALLAANGVSIDPLSEFHAYVPYLMPLLDGKLSIAELSSMSGSLNEMLPGLGNVLATVIGRSGARTVDDLRAFLATRHLDGQRMREEQCTRQLQAQPGYADSEQLKEGLRAYLITHPRLSMSIAQELSARASNRMLLNQVEYDRLIEHANASQRATGGVVIHDAQADRAITCASSAPTLL